MSDEIKGEGHEPSQRPRSPRVPVDFAVELEGRAADGEPFHVQAKAIKISRGGATILTDAKVAVGAILRLTPPFGRTLEAEVNGVWRDEASGGQCVGVRLLDANGWFAE